MAGRAAASAAGALLVSLVRPARWAPSLTRSGSRGGDGPGAGGGGGPPPTAARRAPTAAGPRMGWPPARCSPRRAALRSPARSACRALRQADSGVLSSRRLRRRRRPPAASMAGQPDGYPFAGAAPARRHAAARHQHAPAKLPRIHQRRAPTAPAARRSPPSAPAGWAAQLRASPAAPPAGRAASTRGCRCCRPGPPPPGARPTG